LDRIVEPGEFHLQIGSNSIEGQVVTLTVR
jgi:hypothetical protein